MTTFSPLATDAGLKPLLEGRVLKTLGGEMTAYETVRQILDPGVEAVEEPHSEIKDAMNLLGRVVAAVEHLAKRLDELENEQGRISS